MKTFLISIISTIVLLAACKTTSKLSTDSTQTLKNQPKLYQLSVELKPSKAYVSSSDSKITTKVIMPGMDPIEQLQNSFTKGVMHVGPKTKGGEMKILTTIDSMDISMADAPGGGSMPELNYEKWRIHQHLTANDSMVMDSMVGVPEQFGGMMDQMMRSMMVNYKLPIPEKGMALGDSFVQEAPIVMDIPGGMGSMNMMIRSTYTLNSVDEKLAHFATSIDISGTMEMMGESSDIVGKGTGTAKLNHLENYMTEIDNVITQDIELNMMGQSMTTSTTTTTAVNVEMKGSLK